MPYHVYRNAKGQERYNPVDNNGLSLFSSEAYAPGRFLDIDDVYEFMTEEAAMYEVITRKPERVLMRSAKSAEKLAEKIMKRDHNIEAEKKERVKDAEASAFKRVR